MTQRPIIGITTQTLQAIDGIPSALPPSVVMNQRYYEAVAAAGGAPILIPLLEDLDALRATYEACAGILIPGGVDMDPATYGEGPHERLGRIDPARDRVELQLTHWAVADRKPLLGLCRGLQVINVNFGGTLYQDIPTQVPSAVRHLHLDQYDQQFHDMRLLPGTRLASLYPGVERAAINSIHHQAVKDLGRHLIVEARSDPDGLVEAIRWNGPSFVFGMQWHPEFMAQRRSHAAQLDGHPLLEDFLSACLRRRG